MIKTTTHFLIIYLRVEGSRVEVGGSGPPKVSCYCYLIGIDFASNGAWDVHIEM